MSLPLIFFAATCAALLYWRAGKRTDRTYGSARFASVWKVFKAGLFKQRGLRVGDWTGSLGVYYPGSHALTIGATGKGKGTTAILPNLLRTNRAFLVDPGGENTAIASKFWRARGYDFYCINPFDEFTEDPYRLPSHGFNPLDMLDPQSRSFAADARALAEMLTPRNNKEVGSNKFFKDAAEDAKTALIIHIMTAEPPENRNLARLYELVNVDTAGWYELIAAMKANRACADLVRNEANKIERRQEQSPEEFSAVDSTIQQDMNWLADPAIRASMTRSDIDFRVLKKGGGPGVVISVVMPLEYVETHGAITRLAMACTVLAAQRRPYAEEDILFLIDEAAALGKITRFPNWLATLRKYRVSVWSIWQNLGQIKQLYTDNWEGVLGNCGLIQILGVGDVQSAEYAERLLGRSTAWSTSVNPRGERSTSQTARPLLTADELLRLRPDKQIACVMGLPPIVLNKTPYWKQAALSGRYHPNPYRKGMGDRLQSSGGGIAESWAKLYYALVCLMAPHPTVAVIATVVMTLSVLLWLSPS